MDFFEYASVASVFGGSLTLQLVLGAIMFLMVFVFESVGLFTIAKRADYKNKWMAFVPFLNTYYIGACAQKNKFYKLNSKTVGIATAVSEFITFVGYVLFYVAIFLIKAGNYYTKTDNGTLASGYPPDLAWAGWMYNYLDIYVLQYLELIYIFLHVCLLICFFQTYASRRYVLFTITSILFPIQGILIFVVRNNSGISYRDFVQAEQARQYQQYQQYQQMQQQQYQNPYSRTYNPTGESPYENNAANTSPDDPFDGFGGDDAPQSGAPSGNSEPASPSGDNSSPFDELN